MMVQWTEQDILDAQRLLRVLVERSERHKASGSLKAPEQIHDPAQSLLDERPEASGLGVAQTSGRQHATGEDGSDHVAEVGNGSAICADGVIGLEGPGGVLKHPSATSADLFQNDFTSGGSGVRREAGDVRWGKG